MFHLGCPQEVIIYADVGACNAILTYTNPTATDNCLEVSVVRTAGPASGSVVSVGEYLVTFTASDFGTTTSQAANGVNTVPNTATCTIKYIIKDNELPKITCPVNIISSTIGTTCSAPVSYATPMMSDNCFGPVLLMTSIVSTASAQNFNQGTTIVSYSVTDAYDNIASCSFTITVNDLTAPQISKVDIVFIFHALFHSSKGWGGDGIARC